MAKLRMVFVGNPSTRKIMAARCMESKVKVLILF